MANKSSSINGADKYCINKIKLVKTNGRDQERGYSEYMRNALLKNFLGVTTSGHGVQAVQEVPGVPCSRMPANR